MKLREWGLTFAWMVALGGMLVSLFFSAVLLKEPCNLCWYQRMALFPLAIQLGIAAYHSDKGVTRYAYPLCFLGFLMALYQSILPLMPAAAASCGSNGNCLEEMPIFWDIQFPWLSAAGFVLIAGFIWIHRGQNAPPSQHQSQQ